LHPKNQDYIFFLVVSTAFILVESCFAVSGFGGVVFAESTLAVESAVEVDFEPGQEAKDTANAKAPNFSVFSFFSFNCDYFKFNTINIKW
jgi:hypothetical protein